MKFYFIVPDEKALPSKELLKKLGNIGHVEIVKHKGRLKDLEQIKSNKEDKILAVDPDSFDWDLDAEAAKNIPSVKAILTDSTSFDWLKPQILRKANIVACNVPGFSLDAVAEYAVAMAIEVSRRLPLIIKNGWKVNFKGSTPVLLKDKIAGIVGLGRIGKRMAEICQGIGMEVIYWSRNSIDNRFKKVELDELFKTSDVIMPALIESTETKKIITKKLFDSMKRSAVLVGINRVKAIWDENYIFKKVKKGEIAGYAMEGDNAKEPVSYEGNVWALPPMAWNTQESLDNLMRIWIDNMIAFAKGKPQNVVN